MFAVYMASSLLALGMGQFLLVLDDGERFLTFGLASILFSVGLVPVALTRTEEPPRVRVPHLGLHDLGRVAPVAVAVVFVAGVATSAFWGVGAVFAQRIGLDRQWIAAFMSSVIFGGVVLQLPIGRLSDHMDRRIVLVGVCVAASASALGAWACLGSSLVLLLVLAFLYGGFSFSIYGLAAAHAVDQVDRDRVLVVASGLLRVYGIGAVFGPALGGLIMQAAGPPAFLLLLAALFVPLTVFAAIRVGVAEPVPAEARGEFVPLTRTTPVVLQMHPEGAPQDAPPSSSS